MPISTEGNIKSTGIFFLIKFLQIMYEEHFHQWLYMADRRYQYCIPTVGIRRWEEANDEYCTCIIALITYRGIHSEK